MLSARRHRPWERCSGRLEISWWVTHQSIQWRELEQTRVWREQARKPVVVDECRYECNIWQSWGNITAQEMIHRFWLGTVHGGYVGRGETYEHPADILW